MSEVLETVEAPAVADEPVVSNSILISVRPMCNVDENDNGFDKQLIPLINSQMMVANHEMGVGIDGFNITGESEEWSDWLGTGEEKLAAIKTWLGYSVLLLFDPPDNATVLKAIQQTVDKFAWMLESKSRLQGFAKTIYPVEYVEED